MDEMVLTVQQWLNQTYTGVDNWTPVTEDGITGWETVNALLEALQIEEGITDLSPNFGPATTANFKLMQYTDGTTVSNKNYILQGGFWCKGIGPGAWNGIFDTNTEQTVKNFQADAGIAQDGIVTAMLMKALLNMDAFVLVSGGDANIREVQQSLNAKYNAYFGLVACDGVYERSTNTALIYALQAEEGLSTSVANGVFGPTTTADCPTLQYGDSGNFVLILQWALYCNSYDPNGFDGVFGNGVRKAVENFQTFMGLPVDGVAGLETIEALLTSAGDTNRTATACDTATILTSETAQELKAAGYQYVGRYLTGTAGNPPVPKALTATEYSAIVNAGLKLFFIYEDGGDKLDYFTADQGTCDAVAAINAAQTLGVPEETTIYFAVDYDALDTDIANNIIPYFDAINSQFLLNNDPDYKLGVYGTRNVCNQLSDVANLCFVADMSTGWSGNLGFKMPTYWAYDQFVGKKIGVDNISIDADGYSGRDAGVSSITTNYPTQSQIDQARIDAVKQLADNVLTFMKDFVDSNTIELGTEYTFTYGGPSTSDELLEITFEASGSISSPDTGSSKITLSAGETGFDVGTTLNNLGISTGSTEYNDWMSISDSLALQIGDGTIYLQTILQGTVLTLNMEIDYLKLPVVTGNDSFDTTMSLTISISWDYSDNSQFPDIFSISNADEVYVVGLDILSAAVLYKILTNIWDAINSGLEAVAPYILE